MFTISILRWKKQRGRGAIGFGDNPHPLAGHVIRGENASAVFHCVSIGLRIFFGDITPIASHVAHKVTLRIDCVPIEVDNNATSRDNHSEGKQWLAGFQIVAVRAAGVGLRGGHDRDP